MSKYKVLFMFYVSYRYLSFWFIFYVRLKLAFLFLFPFSECYLFYSIRYVVGVKDLYTKVRPPIKQALVNTWPHKQNNLHRYLRTTRFYIQHVRFSLECSLTLRNHYLMTGCCVPWNVYINEPKIYIHIFKVWISLPKCKCCYFKFFVFTNWHLRKYSIFLSLNIF